MSTIFGICRTEGPATRGDAGLLMLHAMDHWGADRQELCDEGCVLLGHLLLMHTGGSSPDAGIQRLDRMTITADVRLDNREELLRQLRIGPERGASMPDALLVLHLYRDAGTQGLARLVGDFAFAIHDPEARTLVCYRDPMGVRPLHYALVGGDLLFASESRGILAHPEADASLDEDFILRLMAGLPPDPDATFHRGIRHLPPGHALRWQPDGITIRPLRSVLIPPLLRMRHAADCQEAYREHLREAVVCRLPATGPVGVELSGGLDSSAVAAFTATSLPDTTRVHSFTNVGPEGLTHADDEWPFAAAVAAHCGITNTVRVSKGVWTSPFEAVDRHIFDHCGVDIVSPFWLEPARRLMSARGIRTCLSGFFGDEVATHHGRLHYHDLWEDHRPWLFLRACLQRGDYTLPLRRLAGAMLPEPLRRLLRRTAPTHPFDPGYLLGPPPVSVGWADDTLLARPFSHRRHLLGLASGVYALRRMQNESIAAIRHRIVPRYPFADIRLIEFVLSLPAEWTGHARTDRYLYRSSLVGIVPDKVRLRRDKQVPTDLFPVHEFREQAGDIRARLAVMVAAARHPLAQRLDYQRMVRDLDPQLAANRWEGDFFPRIPFHILALARYFDEWTEGGAMTAP